MRTVYSLFLGMLISVTMAQAQTCPATVSTFPYSENFETGAGNWVASGTNSSWAWGTPAKQLINAAASGTKAWATSLNGPYNSNEISQVTSPCFNMSTLISPVIEFKAWWNAELNWDGAVLQSSVDGGITWQNVGAFGDPDNWFNSNNINAGPGDQTMSAEGWTGTALTAGWVTVKHRLTGLGGQNSVKLRIAFASDFSGESDGFAFDDVMIYELPATDVGVIAIVSPNSGCGLTNAETVSVTVKNFGSAAQTAIPVSYKINAGTWVNETIAGPLAPDSSVTFSFAAKANLSATTTYLLQAQTNLPGDVLTFNNTAVKSTKAIPTISAFPYFENFENGPNGWAPEGTNSSWALGTPSKLLLTTAGSGTSSWVTNLTGDYNGSEDSKVVSPCFNLSSLTYPVFEMKAWWSTEANWDGAVLQSSIDGGNTWQNVGAFGDPNNWYNNFTISSAPGNQIGTTEGWSGDDNTVPASGSGGWVTVKNYLPNLAGQPSVKLRVAFASDPVSNGEGFAFDDVSIHEAPANDVGIVALLAPLSSTCGAGTQENVTVSIKNFGSVTQTSIPVTYSFTGAASGTGSGTFTGAVAPGATAIYTLPVKANISAAGTYKFTATTNLASDNVTNNNSRTDSLTVFNPIVTFPYMQNFETATTGSPGTLPDGWTMKPIPGMWAAFRWDVNEGSTPGLNSGPNVDHTSGTATGKYVFTNSDLAMQSDSTELISPCINLSSLTNPGVDFWYHRAGAAIGDLKVEISTNNGLTWNTLYTFTGPQQVHESDPWLKKTISLSGYTGVVKLRFKGYSGMGFSSGGDMAIDDVRFFDLPVNDIEVLALTLPNSVCGLTATENICIGIKNNGFTTQTNFPLSYQVNNNPVVTENFTGSIAPGATALYCFTTKANLSVAGTYNFTGSSLLVSDGDPLNNSATGMVTSIPTINTFPYVQNFENGNGGWVASGTNSSWALGNPAKPVINSAASGTHAWVTSLTGTHNGEENSQVLGPCFNFSGIADPDFEMKVWWSCRWGNTGAVLQSSVDGGQTWQNVGTFNDPDNWYNYNAIGANPGGQTAGMAEGWTGNQTIGGSNGWVTVKHKLTGLGGQPSVKLRIAFASLKFNLQDGFAFDDVQIIDNTNNLAITNFVPMPQLCGFNTNEPISVELKNLGSTPVTGFTLSYTVDGGPAITQPFSGTLAAGATTNFTFTSGANLSLAGAHTVVVTINHAPDPVQNNNSISYAVNNSLLSGPPVTIDFETPASGLTRIRTVTKAQSAITMGAGASCGAVSTQGMIMDGIDSTWVIPAGLTDPWSPTTNPEYFAGAYVCFSPAGGSAADSLYLTFDLKQLFKTVNANTNFRVTINGVQVGQTYRPPFGGGTPAWQKVKVNLYAYKNLPNIQIGLESSVSEAFANGSGNANLIDNIRILRRIVSGTKSEKAAPQIIVYPNPSEGAFTVSLPNSTTFEMEVTDLTGKVIHRQQVKNNSAQVNLPNAAKGIYLLKITSEGNVITKKLIVE